MNTQHHKKWYFISLICFLCFAIVAISIITNQAWLLLFDQTITHWIRPIGTPSANALFGVKFITAFGGIEVIVPLMLLFATYFVIRKKDKGLSSWLVLNIVLGAGLLNVIAKHLFLRPRPSIEHFVKETGWSFPSGHSMGSMICYVSIAFALIYLSKNQTQKIIIALFCAVLIFAIGISRIYLGVHYPSDVVGGFTLGFAWMALAMGLFGWWIKHFDK